MKDDVEHTQLLDFAPDNDTATLAEINAIIREAKAEQPSCLVCIYPKSPFLGRRYSLEGTKIIGRDPRCDISIGCSTISRRHARLEPIEDTYEVHDLGSTNGTFINEAQVNQVQKLRDGDYLRIGNFIWRFLSGGNIETVYHDEIYRLTIVDGLTDIYNKRYLYDFLEREISRAARHRRPVGLLMFDIDKFKQINSDLGHLGGDYVLKEVTKLIKSVIRKEEVFTRYGGEEFVIVTPEISEEGIVKVAERLRQTVAQHPFLYQNTQFSVTISVGVSWQVGTSGLSATDMIADADRKLYKAKNSGRNCVIAML